MNNEQIEFLKKHVKGRTRLELLEMLNNKFNSNFTIHQLKYYKKKYNIKSEPTTFKKGYKPHNYKNLYEEFENEDGYVFIKTQNPNTWQLKHRFIYEQRFGSIPKDYCVIFADGNKKNFDINNLILVHQKDKLVMKNLHLFSNDKDITTIGLTIAKLINENSKRKKEG